MNEAPSLPALDQLERAKRWECLCIQARSLVAGTARASHAHALARAYLGCALERLNELEPAVAELEGVLDCPDPAVRTRARASLAVAVARLAKGGVNQIPAVHWNTQQLERAMDLLQQNREELAAGAHGDGAVLQAIVANLLALARVANDLAVCRQAQPRNPVPAGSPPSKAVSPAAVNVPSGLAPESVNREAAAPAPGATEYLQQAHGFLAQARAAAAEDPVLLAQVAWTASFADFVRGDYRAALKHLHEAQTPAGGTTQPGLLDMPPRHWVMYQIAISHHHLGETTAALDACLQALMHLRDVSRAIAGDQARMKSLGDKYKIHSSAVHLACRLGQDARAFACSEQSKSQTLNELLYPSTAGDAGAPSAIPALEADAVRALLPDDTLLISYFLGRTVGQIPEADTGIALASNLPPVAFRLGPAGPVPDDGPAAVGRAQCELRRDLDAVRKLSGDLPNVALLGSLLTRLSGRLLAPLERHIELGAYQRLLFVPHKELHGIPLHDLRNAEGRPLLDRFVVSYLPSAGLLRRTGRPGQRRSILLVVPDVDPPLPDALREARQISDLYATAGTEARLLHGPAASHDAVLAAMPAYGVVHIVTHGKFDERDPMASCVQLTDGPLTAQTIRDQGVGWLGKTHLVTLSACATGRQSSPSGDESQGLTRALLAAGVTALVVTGWPVSDAFSRDLMVAFYRAWLAGRCLDDALRAAAQGLTAPGRHPPPMPFMLVGGGWRR